MTQSKTILAGLMHALVATAYIALVVFVVNHASAWFGPKDNAFSGMAALMLLVLSAAVMASLTFLRPILWYVDGQKREALMLFAWTIGFLFIFTFASFVGVAMLH